MGIQERSKSKQYIQTYTITIEGIVKESWSDWLSGMEIVSRKEIDGAFVTILRGAVADQAALRGILTKLWDLNVRLIAVVKTDLPFEDHKNPNS